ncbi:spindle assembly abnormal protein 6 homolog isoform X5 [Phycodurus eques]|uniref:spindle assembly abnormal protein 6 homolog isoform X5 n=1 Tax=Phycodurus eques TaxID=693459 RepID=UPI002ACD6293|nr:spindle assembly abnormal protein 6 homolog isoform X5 [Phycodurus eques]
MVGLAAKSAKMEKMFSKVVQVTVRCRDCDERKAHTRVAIELQASKSGVHKRDLVVRLTDDTDPYFLFNLTLCQEDFQSLKVQQGLLIEFTSFPEKLIELLHRCQSEQSSSHPRFQLLLSCDSASLDGPAHLSVMETNSFKHINHLSLRLDPGSDKLVKDYLAVCLSSLKAEKEALEVKLQKSQDDLIRQLNYAQQALSEKSQELEHQRSEWTLQSSTLSSRHADELRSEREKTAELQNRLQQQTQQLRQDLESAHQRSSRQMQSRLAELETSCGELTDRKYKNEAVLRDLESKLAGVEEECQRAKQQAASLRRENGSLDAALRDKERLANRLQTRVAVLEQKVKDEEALVSRTEEALKATRQQKESVQENAQSKEVQLRNLEAQGKILSEDVKKFVCFCIVELKEKLESSVQKLTETKGVLQKNENVISRLNKQLNEKQLSGKFAAPSENTLAAALTSAGPRQAHFYPHATIAAVTPDIIHKHAMSDSAGLDAKYFKRRDDAVPVYALPDALVPRGNVTLSCQAATSHAVTSHNHHHPPPPPPPPPHHAGTCHDHLAQFDFESLIPVFPCQSAHLNAPKLLWHQRTSPIKHAHTYTHTHTRTLVFICTPHRSGCPFLFVLVIVSLINQLPMVVMNCTYDASYCHNGVKKQQG